ncbi:hypothetical protein J9303_05895 [Bacillaceae bacterium Marseille-Q3522]|nr:hypothetical protein [Bacillaceae bacterium Marseille-Q3522]
MIKEFNPNERLVASGNNLNELINVLDTKSVKKVFDEILSMFSLRSVSKGTGNVSKKELDKNSVQLSREQWKKRIDDLEPIYRTPDIPVSKGEVPWGSGNIGKVGKAISNSRLAKVFKETGNG